MRTTRQKHKSKDRERKKRAVRKESGPRYVVVHDGLYASTAGPTTWVKDLLGARIFRARTRAENYAKEIRTGPRQFAGLGSKAKVVMLSEREE